MAVQPVVIRDVTDADRDAVIAVTIGAYEQYAAVMQPAHWADYRASIVETLRDSGGAACILATRDGMVVGSILFYAPRSAEEADSAAAEAAIRLLAVAPAARGQGIGLALVEECVRRAKDSGASALVLHTTDMMAVAKRMYERIGFERDSSMDFSPHEGVLVQGYRLNVA